MIARMRGGFAMTLAATLVFAQPPGPAAAAIVYPAIYWYSMIKIPEASEVKSLPGGLNQYVASIKNLSCIGCHQIDRKSTRLNSSHRT